MCMRAYVNANQWAECHTIDGLHLHRGNRACSPIRSICMLHGPASRPAYAQRSTVPVVAACGHSHATAPAGRRHDDLAPKFLSSPASGTCACALCEHTLPTLVAGNACADDRASMSMPVNGGDQLSSRLALNTNRSGLLALACSAAPLH